MHRLWFFSVIQDYRATRDAVIEVLGVAYDALADAEIDMGALRLEQIASGITGVVDVNMRFRNVMGVLIPLFKLQFERGVYPYNLIGTSVYLDTASVKFSDALVKIIKLAEVGATLMRIADEVKRVRRRVNALESMVIPNIEKAISYIELYLAEREREDLFRFKRIKKKFQLRR